MDRELRRTPLSRRNKRAIALSLSPDSTKERNQASSTLILGLPAILAGVDERNGAEEGALEISQGVYTSDTESTVYYGCS